MEVTKRTYQKHKTDYKLRIKHYSNTSIKEFDSFGNNIYPIYVEATFKRKTTRFRSRIPAINEIYKEKIYAPIDWENFDYDSNEAIELLAVDDLEEAVRYDVMFIESIVNYQLKVKPLTFNIYELPRIYHKENHSISFFVDWCLKCEIQEFLFEERITNFVSRDFEPDYKYENIDQIFPVISSTTALNNFEFYLKKYPKLEFLKQKFNSQVWIFDMYLEIMSSHNYAGTYWDFGTFQNYYADFGIIATLNDFEEHYFHKHFLNCFKNEQFAKDILQDIEILFLKYRDSYDKLLMS